MDRGKVLGLCLICGERPRIHLHINCGQCNDEMPYRGFSGSGKLGHE